MKIRFLSPANIELNEAIDYYDHQLPGLGFRFLQEVSSSIERIKIMPEAWTKIGIHTRRCIIKGFPYAVLFVKEENTCIVTAIAHLHRNPEHFKKRIF
ncbi:MAG: type II toxin-antitoxin system RelE/ParE family toxin [Ignavibacteriaceae bacterium]|nr:type II toxin-antitoxin system RelE/ParE family toxin [Ignavibacteriaceae bacterium]